MNQSNSSSGRSRARRTIPTFIFAVLALVACGDPPAPVAPTIASFAADPQATSPGSQVTLSWQVTGATSLRLLPGDVDVAGLAQFPVTVDATTSFTLVAENALGTVERHVLVDVGPRPSIGAFATSATTVSGGVVNPGLGTTLSWATTGAETVTLRGPGLGGGVDVTAQTSYVVAALEAGAVYTLVAANAFGAVEEDVIAARAVPAFGVLIAGQSNAQGVNLGPLEANAFITAAPFVRMLGNDYVWKAAFEPLDDCTNQVDTVSADPFPGCSSLATNTSSGVSAGVSLGNSTSAATGGTVFLIPAARGGSGASAWLPQADPYDRDSLFGSAAHRARMTGLDQGAPLGLEFDGVPYGALVWYQGETDTANTSIVNAFESRTRTILDAFRAELDAPTILVQLGRRGEDPEYTEIETIARNLRYQSVREIQRLLAADTLPSTYLVVTHDLPMHPGDGRHLSAAGQEELGRRISLAIREHLLGDASVDGSGPELVAVEKRSNTEIWVRTSRPVRPPTVTTAAAYGGYFAVLSEADAAVPISSISRLASDSSVVRIVLSGAGVAGPVQVRYMPPPGIITSLAADVIRSATCDEPIPNTADLCLPMAAFGDAFSLAEDDTMRNNQFYDVE